MHHNCEVLDWPSVHDLYPFVGMRAERRIKRKSPAKPRTVKSLAAPAKAAQGACTMHGPLHPFALQFTEPKGFWTAPCRSVVMRRYDRAYSVDCVGGVL